MSALVPGKRKPIIIPTAITKTIAETTKIPLKNFANK